MATVSASSSPPAELRAGDVLAGKYELIRPLGTGGMAAVWSACNLITSAEVAVKVLLPMHARSADGLARFRREAQATASLSHRAIVRVFDLVEFDPKHGSLVLIMERLRGYTLARAIEKEGALSVEDTLEVIMPILSALSHAHGLGIIHRDLKPDNVFLAIEPDGHRMPKLMDFGISKWIWQPPITLDGQIFGTFGYMSPEQTVGREVDARTDIFSIGVLLYECLSGKNPFHNPFMGNAIPRDLMSLFEIDMRPLQQIPPELWRVIERALAKQAADRFESAADLADALRRAVPDQFLEQDERTTRIAPEPAAAAPRRSPTSFVRSYGVWAGALFATLGGISTVAARATSTRPDAPPTMHLAEETRPQLHAKHAVASVDTLVAPDLEAPPVDAPELAASSSRPKAAMKPARRSASLARDVARQPGF
jgi:serine/threonine-protein kinase